MPDYDHNTSMHKHVHVLYQYPDLKIKLLHKLIKQVSDTDADLLRGMIRDFQAHLPVKE